MGKRPIIELIPTWDSSQAVCMVCLVLSISVQNTGRGRFPVDSSSCRTGVDYMPGIGGRRYQSSAGRTWFPEGIQLLISGKRAVFSSGAHLLAKIWPQRKHLQPAAGDLAKRGRRRTTPRAEAALSRNLRGYVGGLLIFGFSRVALSRCRVSVRS